VQHRNHSTYIQEHRTTLNQRMEDKLCHIILLALLPFPKRILQYKWKCSLSFKFLNYFSNSILPLLVNLVAWGSPDNICTQVLAEPVLVAPHHTGSSTVTGVVLTVQQIEELLTTNNINTAEIFKMFTFRQLYIRASFLVWDWLHCHFLSSHKILIST
jgi:hypothetical protein